MKAHEHRIAFAIALVVLTSGCTVNADAALPTAIKGRRVSTESGVVKPDPVRVRTGATVDLTWRDGRMRGVPYYLLRREGDEWSQPLFLLTSGLDGKGGGWQGQDEQWAWVNLGIKGQQPDEVTIPPVAAPGEYLICSANTPELHCARIEVVDR